MSNKERKAVDRGERQDPDSREAVEALRDDERVEALPASEEELEDLLREQSLANALPTPPALPGWHQVWLSITNTYTPIQQYVRLGYVPVRPEEHPSWAYLKQHGAQHGGDGITCNEMVLYKITERAYQQIMRHLHHTRPNEEEERLRANIQNMKNNEDFRDSKGVSLIREVGDDLADSDSDLAKPVPTFK